MTKAKLGWLIGRTLALALVTSYVLAGQIKEARACFVCYVYGPNQTACYWYSAAVGGADCSAQSGYCTFYGTCF